MADDLLDDLAEGVQADLAAEPSHAAKPEPQGVIQKVNYSHDGMINLIIAHRGISQNQIAQHFGYSASWVSQVMSSDAFQARLAERAAEIEDPTIRATVEEGLKGLITRSMEIIKEKLKGEASAIPDNLAIRTLELSTRALGMGAKAPVVQVGINVENHLDQLGGRLTTLLTRKKAESLPQQPALEPQQ
jgi:transcriptional regulator with XRE-family HTH domain